MAGVVTISATFGAKGSVIGPAVARKCLGVDPRGLREQPIADLAHRVPVERALGVEPVLIVAEPHAEPGVPQAVDRDVDLAPVQLGQHVLEMHRHRVLVRFARTTDGRRASS